MKKYLLPVLLCLCTAAHAEETCTNGESHTFANGLKLTEQTCRKANDGNHLVLKLIWQPKNQPAASRILKEADGYVDWEIKDLGGIIAVDYYRERGGTLILVDWQNTKPQFYTLDYAGHDEGSISIQHKQSQIHLQRSAFKKNFGSVLKLQAAPNGWRVINPEKLPEFTDRDKMPPIPMRIIPKESRKNFK